jgi:excisionase family DNA binding protein
VADRVIVDGHALRTLLEVAVVGSPEQRAAAVAQLVTSSAPAPAPRAAVTIGEAADALGVSPRTIRRRLNDGSLPTSTLGSRRMIPTAALAALANRGQTVTEGDTAVARPAGAPQAADARS